uniref:DNA excision repair protein ERCC-6-like n=1 Tax=Knipowitschia caucasica TaxID=637954 RepID=A0AAV2MQJ7_KNICA
MEEEHSSGDVEKLSERMETSLCMDAEDSLEIYSRLVQKAKAASREGDLHKTLSLFEKAYKIQPSEKLHSRIQTVKEFLAEQQEEDEDDEEYVDVNGSGLLLFKDLYDKLYHYQKEGVAFLYSLYRDKYKGGILADDMGLGKTIQVISFLSGMYDSELVKFTILVVPTSLITNWTKEFAKWTPGMRVKEFHGSSKSERTKNLEKVQRRGGVLITTYNMLLTNWQVLAAHHGQEFTWDYMILDEAHKIKNTSTKTAKSASAIPSKNRVLLTGTPVQNNLREMWALFDFACQGALLGTAKTFKTEYENPITRAREKDATPGEKVLGSRISMAKLGLDDHQEGGDLEADSGNDIANVPDDTLIAESGKMVFLFELLERLREEGHRTLVFAHYRKVLDILERILKNRGFKVMRLDGTILQMAERERRITRFQRDESYTVFLLTTQVGGVGITLTAADRVVIYDPSWNPATDAQAVDRAYRIGQKGNVVIYRLITCGTVEEKIYRRQVFKDSLIRQNTGDKKNPFRYFSKQELRELFTLQDTKSSTTQIQLQELHSRQRCTDAELDQHIAHLHAMEMFGISDHDLMFSVNVNQDEAPEDQEEHRYIEGRVQKAQELMKAECELQVQVAQSMGSSTEAAWLRMDTQPKERKPRYPSQDLENVPARPVPADVVHLDQSSSPHRVSEEKNTVDLTLEQSSDDRIETSPELREKICKIKKERADPELHFVDHEPVVISDDEAPLHGDVFMNDLEEQQKDKGFNSASDVHKHDLQEMEKSNCSMNNLVIEDSFEEDMNASGQNDKSESLNGTQDVVGNNKTAHSTGDSSLSYVTADDERPQRATSGHETNMDLGEFHDTPLRDRRLSAMQTSLKSGNRSNSSYVMDSLEGNFNLQLDEDSDVTSDENVFSDDKQTEEEERELLSKLQSDGSFDVNKSLAERHNNTSLADNSVIRTTRKKRVARIYSDDEDEEEEEAEDTRSRKDLEEGFDMLAASTPKAAHGMNRSRKSLNASVASRRSLVLSLIDDVGNRDEGESRQSEEEESEEDIQDVSNEDDEEGEESRGKHDVSESFCEDEESEPSGETLNTEEEEEESMEESTADTELASDEKMDKRAPQSTSLKEKVEDYEYLVLRGRECLTRGQQEEALGHFLRAIDMKPGDPEIQLLTIQLYRQLSDTKY